MNSLKEFKEFLDKIRSTNSRVAKEAILKEYVASEAVRYYLHFVFNPYIRVGLSKRKLSKDVLHDSCFDTAYQLLDYLKEHNTGRDVDISKVLGFEDKLDDDLIDVLEHIICKNLPIGIETLTINRVMPGLIPVFSIMLANKYFDNPSIVEGKSFSITTKIDGGRIIAIKKNKEVVFYTRAGQVYEGLVDLAQEMLEKMPDNIMLDGEITLLDSEGLDNKAQYKKTMMITRRDGEKHGVKMKVFDCMSADSFIERKSTVVYENRRKILDALFMKEFKYFELLPILYQGNDVSKIVQLLNEQVSKGEEGVMININNEFYSFNRSNALLKVKKMKDVDLKVIGFEEGSNQNAGKLGAFVVDYFGNKIRVGAGISKRLREQVWANRDEYLGLTIIVQYFEETSNQAGGRSLRFPVFLDFRYDK